MSNISSEENKSEIISETDKQNKDRSNFSNKVLTVLGIVACVFLTPILILNLILIVQGFASENDKIPNIGGSFPLMVQSGSMSGTVEVGDLIIAHTVDNTSTLAKDDIIVFWDGKPGGTLVTHRIIQVTEDDDGKLAYRTKGDANNAMDANLVNPDSIVGIYQMRIPYLGNIALFMQTIPGLIICVVVPLSLFIIYDVIRRKRIEKGEKEETVALLAELEKLKNEKVQRETTSENSEAGK